jgi:elongation factor 3
MPIDIAKLTGAETPEAREAEAGSFADAFVAAGVAKSKDTFDALKAALADKDKKKANSRAGVLAGLRALLTKAGAAAEPFVMPLLFSVIEAAADKAKPVSIEADKLCKEICNMISANGVSFILPDILAEGENKWQSNLVRCEMFSMLAEKHPAQIQLGLTTIIPVVAGLMWDVKPQVKDAATKAMNDVCKTMDNRDVVGFVPSIVHCIGHPETVGETVHKLAGVVFVSEVYASALAVMAPLLKRGFDDKTVSIIRNTARIVENMAKLVDDPYEVEPFIPTLLPALNRAKEEVSDPECRDVCDAAYQQLDKTSKQDVVWKRVEVKIVLDTLKGLAGGADETVCAYAASVANSMLSLKNIVANDWSASLGPLLSAVMPGDKAQATISKLLEECSKLVKVEEAKEEVDDAEQLCDCKFSLAYGNKVLLNQTVLKLKRGYRYGLCGKNDSGKTTLMRAIADQQVDGFPPPTELRTMFVETDVQGEVAPDDPNDERLLTELSVLDFVANHAGLKKYGVTEEMAKEKLLAVGFYETDAVLPDGTMPPASLQKLVGRLSGGWRMKVALTRAMLMKADILLLDEPTNHLDPGNVKWVIDYLTSLSHVTSIIVSHDIKVLDQVCTHVLQIDNLKLKQYKGNLTEVAEKYVPELMSYFKLKATKFSMRFPQPGMLEGVTSKGKHIMKMTNISFTYPSAAKAQLTGVTVRISLSTRAACIGANGAGKSTHSTSFHSRSC